MMIRLFLMLPIFLSLQSETRHSVAPVVITNPAIEDCQWNGIRLYGKVEFVDAFPDIKIEYVNAFPDLKVEFVEAFPNKCGQWQEVEAFPDFRVQVVKAFPDLKVQVVDAFPGIN